MRGLKNDIKGLLFEILPITGYIALLFAAAFLILR